MTDTPPPSPLTRLQQKLLRRINELEDPTGAELTDILQKTADTRPPSKTTVYRNIHTLEDEGYVEHGMLNARSKWHRLTDRGKQAIDEYDLQPENVTLEATADDDGRVSLGEQFADTRVIINVVPIDECER